MYSSKQLLNIIIAAISLLIPHLLHFSACLFIYLLVCEGMYQSAFAWI
jgi:hypothetical protein